MNVEQSIQSNKFKSEVHKAVVNIMYSAWYVKTIVSKELKEFGLTNEQYNVLRILKGKHPVEMCIKDIAGRMIEKNSNVPRIVDKLLLKKLIKRGVSSVDKRETVIEITQAGLVLLAASTKVIEALHVSNLPISETDAKQLNSLLDKLTSSI
jgi:DNA-binding MarR family transcriptional regulator